MEAKPDVVYIPDFIAKVKADELFARIKAEAKFEQHSINIMGNSAPIPHLEAWYGTWDYPYSSGLVLKAKPIPAYLQAVIDRIKACGFGEYNSVLINLYRDGRDSIGWHSDDDYGDPEPTIPGITLGATRRFVLCRKDPATGKRTKEKVEYAPEHGSLIMMRGRTNADWVHSVPRTAKPMGERINLTFRNGGAR